MTENVARPSQREFDPSDPLSSFVDVLRCVVLHPVVFFAGIPRREGLRNPFLFALIGIVIGAVLNAVVGLVGVQSSFQSYEGLLGPLGLSSQSFAGFVASIVFLVVIGIVSLVVAAAIYQLVVGLLLRRGNAGFRATFRVVAYTAGVTNLVGWIPILGLLVILYGLYLQIVGLREVHETTTGKAILVLVIPFVAVFLITALIAIILVAVFITVWEL
jgi:hypothetical protein